jgi:putative transposase
MATGADQDGYRRVLVVCEGAKEDTESWRQFLRHLKERGLKRMLLVTSDKLTGPSRSVGWVFIRKRIGSGAWCTDIAMSARPYLV